MVQSKFKVVVKLTHVVALFGCHPGKRIACNKLSISTLMEFTIQFNKDMKPTNN